jgi:hypothetical protein
MPPLTPQQRQYLVTLGAALGVQDDAPGDGSGDGQAAPLESGGRKQALKDAVEKLKDPAEATGPEIKELQQIRLEFYGILKRGGSADAYIGELEGTFTRLNTRTTAIAAQVAARKQKKVLLTAAASLVLQDCVAGTPTDKQPLTTLQAQINTALGPTPLTDDAIRIAEADQVALEDLGTKLKVKIAERQARKLRISTAEAAVKVPAPLLSTSLDTERRAVTTPLATDPLNDQALDTAEQALKDLVAAGTRLVQEVKALTALHDVYQAELAGISPDVSGEEVDVERQAAADLLTLPPTRENLAKVPPQLAKLRAAVLDNGLAKSPYAVHTFMQQEVTALGSAASTELTDQASAYNTALNTKAKNKTAEGKRTKALGEALDGFRAEAEAIQGRQAKALDDREKERARLLQELTRAYPAGVAPVFQAELDKIRDKADTLLQSAVPTDFVAGEKKCKEFSALWTRAEQDAIQVPQVAALLLEVKTKYAQVEPSARTAVKARLAKGLAAVEGPATDATLGRDLSKALASLQAFKQELVDVEAENAKAGAAKGKLATAKIGAVTLTPMQVDEFYDALGVAALDDLEAALGNLSQVATLADKVGLADLTATFAEPDDRTNLKDLVAKGGMDVASLGRFLEVGVVGTATPAEKKQARAANLKLVQGLGEEFAGDSGMADLQALKNTGLGSPEALGTLLRDGCGGDASVLKGVHTAFSGDLTQLKATLDTACGANPKKLADLLSVTCDGDGAQLKKLHTAFSTAPGDLAKLKTLSDELGDNSPAKLKRLWDNPKLGGNAAGVKKFYDSLDAFATANNPAPGAAPPSPTVLSDRRAQRARLIKVGGNIEFRDIDGEAMIRAATSPMGKNARVGHACGRHLMACSDLKPPTAPATSTTFWPPDADEAQLAAYLEEAITNLGSNIPSAKADFRAPEYKFAQKDTDVNGGTIQVRVGFERQVTGSTASIRITQFYPRSQPGLPSVSNDEMTKLSSLLKT